MNHSCDQFRWRTRKWSKNSLSLTAEKYPLIKRTPEISSIEYPLSTMEYPLLVQLVERLSQILAGVRSSLLDKTLQSDHHLHAQWYIKVTNFIILRKLFDYQSLQSMCTLHLLQYIDIREPANSHNFAGCTVNKGCQAVMDQQCSLLMCPALASVETVQYHSQIGADIKVTSTQEPSLTSARINSPPRLAEASLLPNSNIVSCSCDHNGGVITSEDGIKLSIPEGAIRDGDLVTFHIATGLFGPFVLPSKRQADVVSPYYWIGVSGSYHFYKPIQVEFEHFGACDPSHYQLLCCEDDDESYIMRPVDFELSFTVQDDISWCTFNSNHFCSYCLYHGCKDPCINRICAIFLEAKNFQYLDQFTVQVWFSFHISYCMKRNEELYTSEGLILNINHCFVFKASSDKTSSSYLTLNYDKDIVGWSIDHSRSTAIKTSEVNFYNICTKVEELRASEEASLFPPCFIINLTKKIEYNRDLGIHILITLRDSNEDILFNLFHPLTSGITV